MARCKFCGAEDLVWKSRLSDNRWELFENNGDGGTFHDCKPEDRKKEFERHMREKEQTAEAVRKHREINGYL